MWKIFSVICETTEETFVCPEVGGNGNYADPATCRRFYQVFFFFFTRYHNLLRIKFTKIKKNILFAVWFF